MADLDFIVFDDEKAVIEGRKTIEIVPIKADPDTYPVAKIVSARRDGTPSYAVFYHGRKPAEKIVKVEYTPGRDYAIMQPYHDVLAGEDSYVESGLLYNRHGLYPDEAPGYYDKTQADASLMPYCVRIKSASVCRLWDITEADCLRAGVTVTPVKNSPTPWFTGAGGVYSQPEYAFARIFDAAHGKGAWQGNPWVFKYEFERIKK